MINIELRIRTLRKAFCFGGALVLSLAACKAFADAIPVALKISLPAISAESSGVTLSGISSGAFFAVQFGVAHAHRVSGVASFAGGIYGCAKGNASTATSTCMKTPESILVAEHIQQTVDLARAEEIDAPEFIKPQKIFIFHGTRDSVIAPTAAQKLKEFYEGFGAEVSVLLDTPAGHGLPALQAPVPCKDSRSPYIIDCGVDGPGKVFTKFYETGNNERGQADVSRLFVFDQREFSSGNDSIASEGYVYIPNYCESHKCRVHVMFHGCLQSPLYVQKALVEKAGYNDWAESKNVVVLYPSVQSGSGNPLSCWDWFGYSSAKYLTQKAPQAIAINKMLDRLSSEGSDQRH